MAASISLRSSFLAATSSTGAHAPHDLGHCECINFWLRAHSPAFAHSAHASTLSLQLDGVRNVSARLAGVATGVGSGSGAGVVFTGVSPGHSPQLFLRTRRRRWAVSTARAAHGRSRRATVRRGVWMGLRGPRTGSALA